MAPAPHGARLLSVEGAPEPGALSVCPWSGARCGLKQGQQAVYAEEQRVNILGSAGQMSLWKGFNSAFAALENTRVNGLGHVPVELSDAPKVTSVNQ